MRLVNIWYIEFFHIKFPLPQPEWKNNKNAYISIINTSLNKLPWGRQKSASLFPPSAAAGLGVSFFSHDDVSSRQKYHLQTNGRGPQHLLSSRFNQVVRSVHLHCNSVSLKLESVFLLLVLFCFLHVFHKAITQNPSITQKSRMIVTMMTLE